MQHRNSWAKVRRFAALLALSVPMVALAGCNKGQASPAGAAPAAAAAQETADGSGPEQTRKVIKRAEMSMSVASPAEAQREVLGLAKAHGGYVVSSEQFGESGAEGPERVRSVIRVRADRFESALGAMRKLGSHVGSENVSSEDVTEEFVDLGARLRTKKKLEERYLVLLEKATTVEDTLKVEKHLADVRGEIEKLEGRQKYLNDQVGMATVTATFMREQPRVAFSFASISRAGKRAYLDAINVTGGIVVGGVRMAGVLLPVLLFVFLPLILIVRFTVNRMSKRAAAPVT
jgi:hypothetical protein